MPRISAEAMKVFSLIWYDTDIKQSEKIVKNLTDLNDIAFGKCWLIYYYVGFYEIDLALAKIKELEEMSKLEISFFNNFFIKTISFNYYTGWNSPIVSRELANQFYNDLEKIYPQIDFFDDWEKYFTQAWYYFNKAVYFKTLENNLIEGISFLEKSKQSFNLVPKDGEYLSKFFSYNCLGYYQYLAGYFDESELNLKVAFQEVEKYDNLWRNFLLLNLISLNMNKGDFSEAKEIIGKSLEISKKYDDTLGIYFTLGLQGDLYLYEGNYDEALKNYQDSFAIRKRHNDPLELVKGYLDFFYFYTDLYNINRSKDYLIKAEETYSKIKNIYEIHPEDNSIKNLFKSAEATLYKFGNLHKRGKSALIFEELLEIYPFRIDIAEEYLELLFDDFVISEDDETIDKIDYLMKNNINKPLPMYSLHNFVTQQITLARYQFYIKNNIEESFEILIEA